MGVPLELSNRSSLVKSANTSLSNSVVNQYSFPLAPLVVDVVLNVMNPARPDVVDLREIRNVKRLGGTVDATNVVEGLVFDKKASHTAYLAKVIAATNGADVLEATLLQPGRFDKQVTVDVPDVRTERKFSESMLETKVLMRMSQLMLIAIRTHGYSGALDMNLDNVGSGTPTTHIGLYTVEHGVGSHHYVGTNILAETWGQMTGQDLVYAFLNMAGSTVMLLLHLVEGMMNGTSIQIGFFGIEGHESISNTDD